MCGKNNTIICVARASNCKRDCDVVALPILTCERLNMRTSVGEKRLRAWSLLLLAATVASFAHMPLGISDRNTTSCALARKGLPVVGTGCSNGCLQGVARSKDQ